MDLGSVCSSYSVLSVPTDGMSVQAQTQQGD
jgi:hypothetical protein